MLVCQTFKCYTDWIFFFKRKEEYIDVPSLQMLYYLDNEGLQSTLVDGGAIRLRGHKTLAGPD